MFKTDLDARALIDRPGYWLVIAPLVWDDGARKVTVPAMFETDLASIPAPFRSIFNVNGKSRRAAVLHDWLYAGQCVTRAEADRIFLDAMAADGVLWTKRWSMYSAVRAFGWMHYKRCAESMGGQK